MAKAKTRGQTNKEDRSVWIVYVGIGLIALLLTFVLIRIGGQVSAPQTAVTPVKLDSSIPTGVTAEGAFFWGKPDAPVTIDLYEDLGCQHCRDFFKNTEPPLEEQYIKTGKVRLISHPIAIVNSNSAPGAQAVMCAADQEKYWEMRAVLFTNQDQSFSRAVLIELARSSGLDEKAFIACYDAQRHKAAVEERSQQALRLGVTGTPTLFIGADRYEGALSFESGTTLGLKAILEQKLGGG